MIKLVKKDLKLIFYSKILWFLPFYTLYLFSLFNWDLVSGIANVLVAFVLIGTISSTIENHDKDCQAVKIYCSLPVKRKEIVYAGYLTGLILTVFAVLFILLSGILLKILFPEKLKAAELIRPGEVLYLGLFLCLIFLIESVLPFLTSLQQNSKTGFFLYLVTTLCLGFWGYPYLILKIAELSGHQFSREGIFSLLRGTTAFLSQLTPALITILVMGGLVYTSVRVAVRKFARKDL